MWQGRFGSVPMDDAHTARALSFVMFNPVRAKLVHGPEQWEWSSARAYFGGGDDPLIDAKLLDKWRTNVKALTVGGQETDAAYEVIRKAETIGRPIGQPEWLRQIERQTGRQLAPKKRGPKPKELGRDSVC